MPSGSRAVSIACRAIVLLACLAVPRAAQAFCGFYVAGADAKLFNNATMVVLMREGTRTILSMQNDYQGPPESFAMIVPVPVVLQKENVKTLPREVFDHVDQMAAPRLVEYWEQDPCSKDRLDHAMPPPQAAMVRGAAAAPGGASELGVRIEAQFTVGEYEIVILSANDSSGLDTWLRREGYRIPEGAEPLLRPYVQAGSKFFVAKVDAQKVKFEKGMAMLSPLRFHYDAETFTLPVRLGLVNSNGTQDLIVHVLARKQRYDVANYPNVTIPTNLDVNEAARDRFGEFYAALFDATVVKSPRAVVTEYAWAAQTCDPCPGPTLRPDELVTLGADALPSTQEVPRTPFVTGTAPPGFPTQAQHLFWLARSHVQTCARKDAAPADAAKATIEVKITDKSASLAKSTGLGPLSKACLEEQLGRLKANTPMNAFSAVAAFTIAWVAQPPNLWDFVLTRLHARYGKSALAEDLVFREAESIVGGREQRSAEGVLENGSSPGPMNNFQARYAIRHPWKGAIECASPRRGIWGGPPGGQRPGPKAARDLAFAPRAGAQVASFLSSPPSPDPGVTTPPTGGDRPEARESCACTVGDDRSSSPAAWLWLLALCAAAARGRTRWCPWRRSRGSSLVVLATAVLAGGCSDRPSPPPEVRQDTTPIGTPSGTAAATASPTPSSTSNATAATTPPSPPSAEPRATAAVARSAAAPPSAAPSAAPTASASAAASPAVTSTPVGDEGFRVWLQGSKSYKAGQPASVEAVLLATGDFHCNDAYPHKFKPGAPAPGVTYPEALSKGASVTPARTTVRVPFVASSPGDARISGKFSFSVCTSSRCIMDSRELAVTVKVE